MKFGQNCVIWSKFNLVPVLTIYRYLIKNGVPNLSHFSPKLYWCRISICHFRFIKNLVPFMHRQVLIHNGAQCPFSGAWFEIHISSVCYAKLRVMAISGTLYVAFIPPARSRRGWKIVNRAQEDLFSLLLHSAAWMDPKIGTKHHWLR